MASVTLEGATKRFGAVTALDGVDLTVEDGEFFVILGPSGAGKTTSLRLIAGLEKPDSGRVRMDGADVTDRHPADRDVAFVFQQYSLYPHLSVRDNIAFPLRAPGRRLPEEEIARRVAEVAALLRIDGKLDRLSTKLSGGEMQRVAIGRALVRQPRAFLMDEPLSSLDAKLREELRVELRRIQRRMAATVLYVTHDQVEALTLADRIAVLDGGRVRQVGTPEEVYDNPLTLDVARRLGAPAINILPPGWLADAAGGLPAAMPAATAHVAIRPEDVVCRLDRAAPGTIPCTVIESSLLSRSLVAERQGVELRLLLPAEQSPPPGSVIHVGFPPNRSRYFDANGQRLAS